MAVYFSHYSKEEALGEYESFVERITNRELEWYEYWQTLSMREGFEDGTWELSDDERSRLDELDHKLRKHLAQTLQIHKRIDEYQTLGKLRPEEYWWWHLPEVQ